MHAPRHILQARIERIAGEKAELQKKLDAAEARVREAQKVIDEYRAGSDSPTEDHLNRIAAALTGSAKKS